MTHSQRHSMGRSGYNRLAWCRHISRHGGLAQSSTNRNPEAPVGKGPFVLVYEGSSADGTIAIQLK
ncbi:hypothetical protein F4680DRAFT_401516 [Xylaria scruposa]|nr:hypothetical protein F4680DRAFT_401516 [Xylaria scruposa]